MKKYKFKNIIVFFAVIGFLNSCHLPSGNKEIKEGIWRGVFQVSEVEIPFQFEVKKENNQNTVVYLMNGKDRFEVDNVKLHNDSVSIFIDLYNTALKVKNSGDKLKGYFIRLNSNGSEFKVPFYAEYGNKNRFEENSSTPSILLSGTWDIEIGDDEDIKKTVGVFEQDESSLSGSILTPTGDYRFLEGVVSKNKFFLSSFGGLTPYLFQGEFKEEDAFVGEFVTPYKTVKIVGKRDSTAALPDAYSVTILKDGYSSLNFSLPNLKGEMVSLSDSKFNDKVVVVSILGSWCPNCLDESLFLTDWYKINKSRGVEIIGLGFERKSDFNYGKEKLTSLKNRLDIQYDILFAGDLTKENRTKVLPELNEIASFPTTIFVDKKGKVRKIHSGFNGPATGKFYDEYVAEFNQLVDDLLAEK